MSSKAQITLTRFITVSRFTGPLIQESTVSLNAAFSDYLHPVPIYAPKLLQFSLVTPVSNATLVSNNGTWWFYAVSAGLLQ